MWRRVLDREVVERRHLGEEALLGRQRRDPAVPKTMLGPDAPTESERTAHEITHFPLVLRCETCVLGLGIESHHVRLIPLERDERPIIAMGFAARKARADDGGADDDLGTILAIVDSSTGCIRAMASETKGGIDYLASSVADFVKNLFVGMFRLRCDNHAERAISTFGEQLRTLRYDTQNRNMTRITPGSVIWILCHEIRTWSGWYHTVQSGV